MRGHREELDSALAQFKTAGIISEELDFIARPDDYNNYQIFLLSIAVEIFKK